MKRFGAALAAIAPFACDLAAFLIPAFAYVMSVSHEPGAWDTAELQGVPYILGISHPTGFPFYVLLGYVWSHALPFGTIAFRMNAMSAAAVAGAVAIAYALAVELGAPRFIALLASLWLAFVHDVWQHANRAETHDLALLLSALAIYLFVRWMRGGPNSWFAGAFAAYGLSLAAHPNALWVLVGLLAGTIVAKRKPSWKLSLGAAALVVVGLGLYLYLPLRSWYVVANGLDPAHVLDGYKGGLFWNYNDPHTPSGLHLELTGSESGTPGFFLSAFNPAHYQDALWAMISGAGLQFGAFALVAATVGLVALWRRDWRVALTLTLSCCTALLFAVTYTNEADVGRYKLLALWYVAPLLALAAPRSDDIAGAAGRILYGVFLAAGLGFEFSSGTGTFSHEQGEGGRWVIDHVRPLVPPGSVLISEWLDATSLAYGAYDDGTLPDRIIVGTRLPEMLDTYREWARSRNVFVLVDPSSVKLSKPAAEKVSDIDPSHTLYRILPAGDTTRS